MLQPSLFDDLPPARTTRQRTTARAAGQVAAEACTAKAEAGGFNTEAARLFVLQHLHKHGPTAGEDLVEAGEKAGHVGHDRRCWGSVFATMSGKLIHCLRSDLPRKRGHGTSGGKLWAVLQ